MRTESTSLPFVPVVHTGNLRVPIVPRRSVYRLHDACVTLSRMLDRTITALRRNARTRVPGPDLVLDKPSEHCACLLLIETLDHQRKKCLRQQHLGEPRGCDVECDAFGPRVGQN